MGITLKCTVNMKKVRAKPKVIVDQSKAQAGLSTHFM